MALRITLVMLIIASAQAAGCQRATPEHVVLQRQFEEIRCHFSTFETDFEAQVLAHDPTADPAEVIVQSMLGNEQALHHLFQISQYKTLDGAGAEGYRAWIEHVFRVVGDARFGEQLAAEPEQVQIDVRDSLLFEFGVPEHQPLEEIQQRFPTTFPG